MSHSHPNPLLPLLRGRKTSRENEIGPQADGNKPSLYEENSLPNKAPAGSSEQHFKHVNFKPELVLQFSSLTSRRTIVQQTILALEFIPGVVKACHPHRVTQDSKLKRLVLAFGVQRPLVNLRVGLHPLTPSVAT